MGDEAGFERVPRHGQRLLKTQSKTDKAKRVSSQILLTR